MSEELKPCCQKLADYEFIESITFGLNEQDTVSEIVSRIRKKGQVPYTKPLIIEAYLEGRKSGRKEARKTTITDEIAWKAFDAYIHHRLHNFREPASCCIDSLKAALKAALEG